MICNTDFDDSLYTISVSLFDEKYIHCWNTTASDNKIEVWHSGFNGVPSYSGNQFIELNANLVSTLYQDFLIAAGSNITISFAHRGRAGIDVMDLSIGPVGGPYTSLGTFSDDNTAWGYYTLNYTIPAGLGNNYSLRFNSISAAGGNPAIGNFLDAISVNIPSNTTLTFSSSPVSCSGNNSGSAEVFVNGGISPYSYTWAPTGGNLANASNLTAGIYTVSVSEATGCVKTGTVQVLNTPSLSLSITSQSVSCYGTTTGSAQVIASGGLAPYSYSWSNSSINTSSITSLSAGVYSVAVSSSNGCSGSTSFIIDQAPLLDFSINTIGNFCEGSNNGTAQTVVNGGTPPYSYLWSPTGQTTSSITSLSQGIYTCKITDDNSCIRTETISIVNSPNPTLTVNSPSVCAGTITNLYVNGANNYTWSPGNSHQPSITAIPLSNITYTIFGENQFGCRDTINATIFVSPKPVVNILTNPSTLINENNFNLEGLGDGILSWYMFNKNMDLICNNCQNIQVNPQEDICYILEAVNEFNCRNSDTICLTIINESDIYIPNTFTPNQDGLNDVFIPIGYGYKKIELMIFDRWGELIFKTDETNIGWNGMYKNQPCKQDVYIYKSRIITDKGKEIFKSGHVNLIR